MASFAKTGKKNTVVNLDAPGEDETATDKIKKEIDSTIKDNKVVVFSKSWCPFCPKVINLMQRQGVVDLKVVEVDHRRDEQTFMDMLKEKTTKRSVPQVFIGGQFIGGCDDTLAFHSEEKLAPALAKLGAVDTDAPGDFDFDFFVIGGGSGGCAAALKAASKGDKKVGLCDFVKPSWMGTTWGVGGTCVNVGCIPKKLMHITSTKKEDTHDLESFGLFASPDGKKAKLLAGLGGLALGAAALLKGGSGGKSGLLGGLGLGLLAGAALERVRKPVSVSHDWDAMSRNIQRYIKEQLNEGMLEGFKATGVSYFNAYGTLKDRHTIQLQTADGTTVTKTAKYIMLACGGRPSDGDYPGKELCVTSDDIFWMKKQPGKTLVVGAAYIALECAGFLTGMGYDTTVMVRSILLRGFDRECVGRIDKYMQDMGTKFIRGTVPERFEKGRTRAVRAIWKGADGQECSEEFDTVLLAIGRTGEASKLGLEKAGIWFDKRTGKVSAPCEQTNVPNIFCIGDLVANRPELTPVAKAAGKKVVAHLFEGSTEALDYRLIATTVFTPLEYGLCGLTEEEAVEKFGRDGLLVMKKDAKPLEWAVVPHREPIAFFKVLVARETERIVGFHVLGPNAGEITQAMALAMKCGAKKSQLDDTIGIHPTLAETMCMLSGEKIKGLKCET